MAGKLRKLKKTRGLTKTAITSLIKKIEEAWVSDSRNLEEMEENLAQLKQKGIDLKQEDNEILSLIDDLNEVEKDVKASSEYHDKIAIRRFRVNKKVKQNNKKGITPISHVDSKPAEVPHAVRLNSLL